MFLSDHPASRFRTGTLHVWQDSKSPIAAWYNTSYDYSKLKMASQVTDACNQSPGPNLIHTRMVTLVRKHHSLTSWRALALDSPVRKESPLILHRKAN